MQICKPPYKELVNRKEFCTHIVDGVLERTVGLEDQEDQGGLGPLGVPQILLQEDLEVLGGQVGLGCYHLWGPDKTKNIHVIRIMKVEATGGHEF